jgi:hypothetical protein
MTRATEKAKHSRLVTAEEAIAHVMKARDCDRKTAIRLLLEKVADGSLDTVTVSREERRRPN